MKTHGWSLISFLFLFSLVHTGCSNFNQRLKSALGGDDPPQSQEAKSPTGGGETKFSENPDVAPRVKRQYKHTTKESIAEESALDSKAGSLWVMEGQGAYLFSQNVVRLVGDPLAVTLEGDPKEQLQSKASIIKKLLAKIEERQKAHLRNPAGDEAEDADKEKSDKPAGDKAKKNTPPPSNAAANEVAELAVKTVPTRIVERTLEGNYRIKGSQPFMIGPREFRIIVTGIVRAEDFNEEGISATKLLDPKFDIVSARKTEATL